MEEPTFGSQRCSAKAHSTGKRCRRWAILGGTVCPMHGGSAPQVQAAARARLQALVNPSIDALWRGLSSDDERIALLAAKMVLDRTTDESGDPLSTPIPSLDQIEAWIAELEQMANE